MRSKICMALFRLLNSIEKFSPLDWLLLIFRESKDDLFFTFRHANFISKEYPLKICNTKYWNQGV
jgi:hypothetical protein